ncbi:MAG: pre-peptidase C-terminal domain-containing protein [bacterium]|nr:pre-peptidase C-terminal domain-containing protein [bacterium]
MPHLSWTPASQTLNYDLFVWLAPESMPQTPLASHLVANDYQITAALTYGQTYKWRLLTRNLYGETLGAEWQFTVGNLPDLTVSTVQAPLTGFSGQSIGFSWTITNIGTGGTTSPVWFDRVFVSSLLTFNEQASTLLGYYQNTSFLAPGESYLNSGNGVLPQGISGPYYIFVVSDYNNQVLESGEANNVGRSVDATDVTLSPYADLRVVSVIGPSTAIAGQPTPFSWTVRNFGTGAAITQTGWSDYLWLSTDSVSGGPDIIIRQDFRNIVLATDSSYTVNTDVTLPNQIEGTYYLILKTDPWNGVYEYVFDENNTGVSQNTINIVLAPPPDLVVTNINMPASGNSGQPVTIGWTVENQGSGPTYENIWRDRIEISKSSVYYPDSVISMGQFVRSGILESETSYTQQFSLALPNGIEGVYYIYATTDILNEVFEHTSENNNRTRSTGTINVALTPWPDLVISELAAPATATAGQTINVSWSVENNGIAPAVANAHGDQIVLLPVNTYIPSQSVATINTYMPSPNFPVGFAYTNTQPLYIPIHLSGTYYLWGNTNWYGDIYEYPDRANNVFQGPSITILPYPPVDLRASNVAGSVSAQSGQSAQVQWTVQNIGTATTLASSWNDAVFLSTDSAYSPLTDVLVTTVPRSGTLSAGQSYSRNQTVTIPNGLSGSYHWIVRSDRDGVVTDVNTVNNASSSTVPIAIALTTPSDLIVSGLSGPSESNAGQPVTAEWLVENIGAGVTAVSNWYDAFYLSQNVTLDPTDTRIATFARNGALASLDSYPVNLTGDLPYFASGNYYLIAKADNSGSVYEHTGESNNIATWPISIFLPPPSDLIVTNVSLPDSANAGDVVTITYTLENVSGNQAAGVMRDAIYFSTDTIWTIDDQLLAAEDRFINIAANGALMISVPLDLDRTPELLDVCARVSNGRLDEGELGDITHEMPGVVPGNYYAIVRTDLRDNIRESDNLNNSAASTGLANVDLPELELDVPDARNYVEGQVRYYRVDVEQGLDLRLTLSSNQSSASNEVYVSFSEVPTLSDFDFSGAEPFSDDQQFFVPSTQAGTYYVMVLARDVNATESVTLLAEALPFSILDISPNVVGQGRVTTTITGAGFRDYTEAYIRIAPDSLLPAASVVAVNSTELKVIWELNSVALGNYDVVLKNSPSISVTELAGLTIEASRGLTYEFIDASPDRVRAGGSPQFTFLYQNTSNANLPYFETSVFFTEPTELLGVQSSGDWLQFQLSDSDTTVSSYLKWVLSGTWSSAQIVFSLCRDLAPGEVNTVTLTVRHPFRFLSFNVSCEAFGVQEYREEQLVKFDALRFRIAEGFVDVDPELFLLASDSAAFADSILRYYYADGIIDSSLPCSYL